ncbi:GH1 family beta-glucosidase [Roseateles sp. PN1]|uniref:GH1 family beta-glucosidase n=1 Tax=Roseateles sp. PN1 TaxID=3137372 RepID=UPI00313A22A2
MTLPTSSPLNAELNSELSAATAMPLIVRSDFPSDFRWGCSTSSYQIEGAIHEDGRGESIWDRFCNEPGRIRDGSSGEVACDHYHRWPEDLDMAQQLGVNAYRFSIAWPRVLPQGRGAANEKGLDFYSRLVDGMLERGLQPWATLYHWDLPQALQDKGGWANRATIDAFLEYTELVARRLGDRVKHWITHNEPYCTAFLGNFEGNHAPGLKDHKTALLVCHHLLLSHGRAVPLIKRLVPDAQVGITLSLHPISPASNSAADAAAAERHDGLRNRWFLDPLHDRGYPQDILALLGDDAPHALSTDLREIATPTDFLGVNYYFPERIENAPGVAPIATRVVETPGVERTAFGWEVDPEGMVTLLTRIQRDYAPNCVYLTENGSTFEDEMLPDGRVEDVQRRSYLARHLAAARRSMAAGVPLKGYFAWSLLDNFEWAEGYLRRFGLSYVDFETQQRTLKASGQWYAQFLQPGDAEK